MTKHNVLGIFYLHYLGRLGVLKKCSSLQSVVRTSVTPWCAQCNYYKDWQFSAM